MTAIEKKKRQKRKKKKGAVKDPNPSSFPTSSWSHAHTYRPIGTLPALFSEVLEYADTFFGRFPVLRFLPVLFRQYRYGPASKKRSSKKVSLKLLRI